MDNLNLNFISHIPEGILTALLGYFGYQSKRRDKRIEQIEKDQKDLTVLVAKEYITREETNTHMRELRASLQRIEDKLDSKVDK